jgi:hypothetical protein
MGTVWTFRKLTGAKCEVLEWLKSMNLLLFSEFVTRMESVTRGIATRYGLGCWGCGFESLRGHGYLCCVFSTQTKSKMQDSQDK